MKHRSMISNHIFLMQTAIRMQRGGFTDHIRDYRLQVEFPEELIKEIPTGQRERHLIEVLANDPRPRYQNRPDKMYGLAYGHNDIHFQVKDDTLTVCDVTDFHAKIL